MHMLIWSRIALWAGSRDASRPDALPPDGVPPYARQIAQRAAATCARLRRRWLVRHRRLGRAYALARQEAVACRAAWAALAPEAPEREAVRRALARAEAAEAAAWQAGTQAASALAAEQAQVLHAHRGVIAAYQRGLHRRWPTGTPLPEWQEPVLPPPPTPWPEEVA